MKPEDVDTKTLQEAIALVPEYIMLRPGVDVILAKDQYWNVDEWRDFTASNPDLVGVIYETWRATVARRPIPADVREAWAVIAMYEANQLPEYPVPAISKAVSIAGKWLLQGGRNA